jgi:hypothetical protein
MMSCEKRRNLVDYGFYRKVLGGTTFGNEDVKLMKVFRNSSDCQNLDFFKGTIGNEPT